MFQPVLALFGLDASDKMEAIEDLGFLYLPWGWGWGLGLRACGSRCRVLWLDSLTVLLRSILLPA